MKVEGKRTKPMVDGMYVRRPKYNMSGLTEDQKRVVQREQHLAVERRRRAEKNAREILAGRRAPAKA